MYRVHDLPPSMRPLVYDFGQLPGEREKDYVRQIVCNCTKRTGKVMNNQNNVLSKKNKTILNAFFSD